MGEFSGISFGIVIAYVIPGFIAILGLCGVSEPVRIWLMGVGGAGPGFSGVVYLLMASIAAGMSANVARWAIVDRIHHWTGLKPPKWDDSRLMQNLNAYRFLIEIHYRYAQFYGNGLVAGVFSYLIWRVRTLGIPWGMDIAFAVLGILFFVGSRDTLEKYYQRSALMLGDLNPKQ